MKNYDCSKTDFVINNFKHHLKGKILDIGCNEGIIAEKLELKRDAYLGLDIDYQALLEVSKRGYSYKRIDLSKENIPLKDNSFDSFLCLDILEHLQDPKRIIKEIKKVVKPHGYGIIALPNDLNLTNILKIIFLGRSLVTRDTLWSPFGHLHFASVKESKILIKENFNILNIFYLPSNYTVPFLPKSLKYFLAKLIPRFFSQTLIFEVNN